MYIFNTDATVICFLAYCLCSTFFIFEGGYCVDSLINLIIFSMVLYGKIKKIKDIILVTMYDYNYM